MSDRMTMMFETEDLEQASPATVSRLGIIYTEATNIGWEVLVKVWFEQLSPHHKIFQLSDREKHREFLLNSIRWLFPPTVFFIMHFCSQPIPISKMEYCSSFLRLLECFLELVDEFGESSEKALEGCF